jgi:hypothetical protein
VAGATALGIMGTIASQKYKRRAQQNRYLKKRMVSQDSFVSVNTSALQAPGILIISFPK